MDHGAPILWLVCGIAVIGAVIVLAIWLDRRRREAFAAVADSLGIQYEPGRDRELARRFEGLNRLRQGSGRYASHVLSGQISGHEVYAFDYHYETAGSDTKGNPKVDHHHLSVFLTILPKSFPELTICPEGLLSKIAQAVGHDDIDFESAEFSRRFCVRSKDRRLAYDVCHAGAMEFLLEQRNLEIEIEGETLAMVVNHPLDPGEVATSLARLLAFRDLMPDYLFTAAA